ncbi:MAG: hypothetical protein Q9216_003988 [Gyalolechia sp. 2 TL-2023]
MASQRAENEDRKRRSPLDTKRDLRQAPSRRYPLSQQAPIFETESLLNTSNAQSPSPKKPTSRPTSRTQSRQAFNSGRSLASAYAATPRKKDENKHPFSAGSSTRANRNTPSKPRPTHTPRSVPKSSDKTQDSNSESRLKTPSPARGRQDSIVSPSSSASSPPRGLAEAYQRIVDEENLAHEESIEEMAEYEDSHSPPHQVQHHDRIQFGSIEENESPTSLKAARRSTPPGERKPSKPSFRDIYESLGGVDNDDTVSSTPESAREDPPIQEDSKHAKDLRRMNGAVKSDPQIFRKALAGHRGGLTVENLRRNNEGSDSLGSSLGGSISSRASDPSFNVPKQWGRKARPGKDWLSRINSKSGKLTGDVPKRRVFDDTVPSTSVDPTAGNKLAVAAAEVPLPSGDDASSQAASSRSSTPTTAALRSKSHDRVLDWELQDEEFTGRSLQVSDSPPIRLRNVTLDKILEQEISTVAKRAVTTSRLGELREKSPAEQLRRRSQGQSQESFEEPNGVNHQEKGKDQDAESSSRRPVIDGLHTPSMTEDSLTNGEPVLDTPVVVYKSDSSGFRASDDRLDNEEVQRSQSPRPKHSRQDSQDLLRKLARATSASPSPSRHNLEMRADHQRANDGKGLHGNGEDPPPNTQKDEHKTPQPSKSNTYLKTPMVTGAWIDTPLPTGGRGPPMPTPDTDDSESKALRTDSQKIASGDLIRKLSPHTTRPKIPDEELKKTAPRLPRSALGSIIAAAKSKVQTNNKSLPSTEIDENPTLLLGDSTIHSLEDLIVDDTDIASILRASPMSPETDATSAAPDGSVSIDAELEDVEDEYPADPDQSERLRLTNPQAYTRQLSRLRNLLPSLRETKKGLASLERAVSAPASPKSSNTLTRQPSRAQLKLSKRNQSKDCTESGKFHDLYSPCERCGCPGALTRTSLQRAGGYDYDINLARISVPIPHLWRWRRDSWRPRLTWWGVAVFALWLLWLGEMWARDRYCRKLFATRMVGYGVDINAPEPPFVLAKVIWRRFGMAFVFDMVRFWAGVFGWVSGFGGAGTARVRQPVSRDDRIPRPEWGPDLSMMDDEYL